MEKIKKELLKVAPLLEQSCVAIGNFDGVHRGHQQLLHSLKQHSTSRNLCPVVLTFSPHPKDYFLKQSSLKIMSDAYKRIYMHRYGIPHVVFLPFEKVLSELAYDTFLDLVFDLLKVKAMVLGSSTQLGRGREGSPEKIKSHAASRGIDVNLLELRHFSGQSISSSRIRKLISQGSILEANRCLGHLHFVSGRVIKGRGMGTELGIPTANLSVESNVMLPGMGVYASVCEVDGSMFPSVSNIGRAPSFEGQRPAILESHLLNFSGQLYGKSIRTFFIKKLREEKKFTSTDALIRAIQQDINSSEICNKSNNICYF